MFAANIYSRHVRRTSARVTARAPCKQFLVPGWSTVKVKVKVKAKVRRVSSLWLLPSLTNRP